MSNNLVTIKGSQLPAHLQKSQAAARQLVSELAGGVSASFPIISYRGKVWRVRKGGTEVDFTDRKGDPIQSIELVLVKSNPLPSKTFFEGKYEEGATDAPTCWSSDGVKPDSGVKDPVHSNCATCPNNRWGSRITEQGKKSRLCTDVRRMAVVFASELKSKGKDAHVFLLRIPPASLNPLKDYAEKVLGPAGVEYFALVTRVGFDPAASYPKLTFRVSTDDNDAPEFLDEETYEAVTELRDSDTVTNILSEDPDYAGAATTGGDEAAAPPQKEAPAAAPAPRAAKPRPVEEEEDVTVTEQPLPRVPAAPVVEAAPEPTPAATKPKKTRASAPAEPAPAPIAPAKGKGNFDDILNNLLG